MNKEKKSAAPAPKSPTAWSKSTLEAMKRMGFNHPDYEG
tara:strand:+ start:1728 stop:1844 length:117 start_codon:yes stop_codon:yes gene_type:complete